jgi:hypothetical protein
MKTIMAKSTGSSSIIFLTIGDGRGQALCTGKNETSYTRSASRSSGQKGGTIMSSLNKALVTSPIKTEGTLGAGFTSVLNAAREIKSVAFPGNQFESINASGTCIGEASWDERLAVFQSSQGAISVSVNVPIVAFTGAAFVFVSGFSFAVQHSVRETVTFRGQVVQIVFVIGSNITDAISTSVGIWSVRVAILNSVGQAMVIGVLIVTDLTGITFILFKDLSGTIDEGR